MSALHSSKEGIFSHPFFSFGIRTRDKKHAALRLPGFCHDKLHIRKAIPVKIIEISVYLKRKFVVKRSVIYNAAVDDGK
jgi:hypothetical protein